MKIKSITIWTFFAILIAGFFPFVNAVADDNTCMLKADANKVHVTVWDEDSGQDRQGKIFEGWLESGERNQRNSHASIEIAKKGD